MRRFFVALLCASVAMPACARRIETVTFASLERNSAGAAIPLEAKLLLPRTAVRGGPFPAVIALHGCGGMYSNRDGPPRILAERLALRVDPLLHDGYAVLFVDSFRARGMREVCTIRRGEPTISPARRRLDVLAALAYLASRPDIARGRIALVGWSHGGSTVLQSVNTRDRAVAAFFDRRDAPPFFRAAVAFYPGCATALKAGDRYRTGAPTRIHIGELDDWTSARTCVELGAMTATHDDDLLVTTYANSYHAFDSPAGELMLRSDVPNGMHPGQGVHVGPNPVAREAANASVRAFLRDRLAP